MASLTTLELSSRRHDWDDLTELVEALTEYVPSDNAAVYTAVQAIAEGEAASVKVAPEQVQEFVAHMQEFNIRAEVKKS